MCINIGSIELLLSQLCEMCCCLVAQKQKQDDKKYGFCVIDGVTEKIGNYRVEPPGLFRGRGDHPKQGMLKERILPKDVIINCSK